MNKQHGSSGLSLLVALAIICFILFYAAPRFLKTQPTPTQNQEKITPQESNQDSMVYLNSYRKGMAGAKAAVEASKERNKSID